MITLNPFVENNKARINQFLNNLCEVGDFYDTLEVRVHAFRRIHLLNIGCRWINTWLCRRRILLSTLHSTSCTTPTLSSSSTSKY